MTKISKCFIILVMDSMLLKGGNIHWTDFCMLGFFDEIRYDDDGEDVRLSVSYLTSKQ
jgi:hypothetical protein